MSQSSLGFHTLTMSTRLADIYEDQLIKHLELYSQKTGGIQMFTNDYGNLVIKFHKEDKGIKWLIRYGVWFEDIKMRSDVIEVTINPKILSGIRDYITAADIYDMNIAIINFNRISKEISPYLFTFNQYTFRRVDYCLNFSLNELVPGCSHELIMKLFRRGDIPPHYVEWMEYDEKAHRMKSRPSSFYLKCDSANINCYSKYMKFVEQSEENIKHGYLPVPQQTMEASRDIIRFEVQCKSPKIYNESRKINENRLAINTYRDLLGAQSCLAQIIHYYKVTIGEGDWYSLSEAQRIVEKHGFYKQKKERLLNVLREVSQCRSLADAKAKHQGTDLGDFKRTVNELARIGINPVTIPREWGVDRIPNLLSTYLGKHPEVYPNTLNTVSPILE